MRDIFIRSFMLIFTDIQRAERVCSPCFGGRRARSDPSGFCSGSGYVFG